MEFSSNITLNFKTKADAYTVVENLNLLLNQHKFVSIGDVKTLAGINHSYIDEKYGWRDLSNINIIDLKEECVLSLPPVEEI